MTTKRYPNAGRSLQRFLTFISVALFVGAVGFDHVGSWRLLSFYVILQAVILVPCTLWATFDHNALPTEGTLGKVRLVLNILMILIAAYVGWWLYVMFATTAMACKVWLRILVHFSAVQAVEEEVVL